MQSSTITIHFSKATLADVGIYFIRIYYDAEWLTKKFETVC